MELLTSAGFAALAAAELASTSLPYQLHSEDRNSMRWSIEARMPMTDYRLVEYVQSLPTEYKVGDGFQKRVLRDAVPGLPPAIARRRAKMGFVSADAEHVLAAAPTIRPLLAAAATRLDALVDPELVLADFDAMVAHRLPYHDAFFRLLSLDAWVDAFAVPL